MNELAFAFGGGLIGALVSFPLMYFALSRSVRFKFSNLKIIALFLPDVLSIGLIQDAIDPNLSSSYLGAFSSWGVPVIVSTLIIFFAYKFSPNPPAKKETDIIKGEKGPG